MRLMRFCMIGMLAGGVLLGPTQASPPPDPAQERTIWPILEFNLERYTIRTEHSTNSYSEQGGYSSSKRVRSGYNVMLGMTAHIATRVGPGKAGDFIAIGPTVYVFPGGELGDLMRAADNAVYLRGGGDLSILVSRQVRQVGSNSVSMQASAGTGFHFFNDDGHTQLQQANSFAFCGFRLLYGSSTWRVGPGIRLLTHLGDPPEFHGTRVWSSRSERLDTEMEFDDIVSVTLSFQRSL